MLTAGWERRFSAEIITQRMQAFHLSHAPPWKMQKKLVHDNIFGNVFC